MSLTAKLTSLLSLAFKDSTSHIAPFYNLKVPENKRGHPYMSDVIITTVTTGEVVENAITVTRHKNIVMILEVKKVVSTEATMLDHSHIIEMLLYVTYMMMIYKQTKTIGVLTNGSVAHCFNLEMSLESRKLLMKGYIAVNGSDATQTMNSLPSVISKFGYTLRD